MKERRYRDLKQKQKARISEKMFLSVCDYYRENSRIPIGEELEVLTKTVCSKVTGMGYGVPMEELAAIFLKKQRRFAERIEKNGIPELLVLKQKKTEKEKLAIKRMQRKNRKRKKPAQMQEKGYAFQDGRFFFIAGYTSGGAPYGVTWEEMD